MRKHIGKALKTRSVAVSTALDKYNSAAKALNPPRPTLLWSEVVDCAFLADFDLLRDTRQDVRRFKWATPAGRLLMDQYYKLQRAHEEIRRLNIEIQRLATYIRDEDIDLRAQEASIRLTDARLAHQVGVFRRVRGRFRQIHKGRLEEIQGLKGFTGSIVPGESIERMSSVQEVGRHSTVVSVDEHVVPMTREEVELEEDGGAEDEDHLLSETFLNVLSIAS